MSRKLSELFLANGVSGLESDDEEEVEEPSSQIKVAALFLSTRNPLYSVTFEVIEHFNQQVTGNAEGKLEKLVMLLTSYGGAGVTRYLALNSDDREALLSTCTSRIPLSLAMKAIEDFPAQERREYLFFSRNLKDPPDRRTMARPPFTT